MNTGGRILLLVLLLLGAPASAAFAASYSLAFCDTSLCANGVTGPFGTVNTTLSKGKINVSVMMNFGYGLYGPGTSGGAFGFNVLDPEAGVAISSVSSGFSVGGTDQPVGGFGTFEYLINGPAVSGALSALVFSVSRTGGFTSALQLEEMSTGTATVRNVLFSGRVVVLSGANAGQNGFAGAGVIAPEPATLLLAATGVAGGVGAWWRRRRRARSRPDAGR